MSDRELLEAAARAAGYQVDQRASHMTWRDSQKLALHNPQGGHTLWNSINDDGDALRLAVELRIKFRYNELLGQAMAWTGGANDVVAHENIKSFGRDEVACCRRAITRAAAAIGAKDE